MHICVCVHACVCDMARRQIYSLGRGRVDGDLLYAMRVGDYVYIHTHTHTRIGIHPLYTVTLYMRVGDSHQQHCKGSTVSTLIGLMRADAMSMKELARNAAAVKGAAPTLSCPSSSLDTANTL